MTAALASLPILTVLALMVGRRWAASRAGIVGAALALLIAVLVFGFGRGVPAGVALPATVSGTIAEALFTSVTILWIVLPALAIHHLQVSTGATDRLRVALAGLAADPRLLALLIGFFFALFVEGAAGFGASVALAAPFLVGVGYRPLDAVVVAMLGHAIGVSFGAIGTPVVAQVAATGLAGRDIAAATARLHVVAAWGLLVVMMVVASRATGQPARGGIWGWTVLAGAAFLVPFWLLATFVGPELPTLAGALVGVSIFVVVLRVAGRTAAAGQPFVPSSDPPVVPLVERPPAVEVRADHEGTGHPAADEATADETTADLGDVAGRRTGRPQAPGATDLLLAAAPYLVLIGLVVLTRLVPPVRHALGGVQVAWTLPGGFAGSIAPLTHPGTLLLVAFLAGAALQRVGAAPIGGVLGTTLRHLGAVAVALVAMLSLARIMVHAGMTQQLAETAAATAGGVWPVLAPMVGVLGTFVTGSATASNVLFTDLQVATAEALEIPVLPMTGAQGFGAAVGNVVCPHNIVAAGATVGLTGAEGDVLRRTLLPTIGYALVGGLLTLWIVLS